MWRQKVAFMKIYANLQTVFDKQDKNSSSTTQSNLLEQQLSLYDFSSNCWNFSCFIFVIDFSRLSKF